MKALTAEEIRESFVNLSQSEAQRITLPGLHEVLWEEREYLGWRDPRAPLRGYLVFWEEDAPRGIAVRAADAPPRAGISAMCSLCRTMQPGAQVTMFTAARAGQPGRDGSSVGTYICTDLACSLLIRVLPPASDLQPSPETVLEGRSEGLLARVRSFSAEVARAD